MDSASNTPSLGIFRQGVEDRELVTLRLLPKLGIEAFVATTKSRMPYEASGLGLDVTTLVEPFERFPVHPRIKDAIRRRSLPLRRSYFGGVDGAMAKANVVNVSEAFNLLSAVVVALAAKRSIPSIVTVYENIPFRYDEEPGLVARKDAVYACASAFVAVTPGAIDALKEEGVPAAKISLIPYGVSAEQFDSVLRDPKLRESWGAGEDTVVYICTGRLIREKGIVELVRALRQLHSTDWKLILVGSGPEEIRIRRVAHRCGVADKIVFTGWVGSTQVRELLRSSDVFVCPSLETPYWKEQLGFSTLEAMAAGLPVVATASGSFPYLLGDAAADLLATPYSIHELTRALTVTLSPSRREAVGRRNRRATEQELSADSTARSYRDLIVRLSSERGARA